MVRRGCGDAVMGPSRVDEWNGEGRAYNCAWASVVDGQASVAKHAIFAL